MRPVLNPTAGVLSLLSFVSYDARRFRFPGSAFVERTELEICLGGPGVFAPFVLNTNRFILPRLAQPQRTGSSFPVRSFEDATLDPGTRLAARRKSARASPPEPESADTPTELF